MEKKEARRFEIAVLPPFDLAEGIIGFARWKYSGSLFTRDAKQYALGYAPQIIIPPPNEARYREKNKSQWVR